MIRLIVNSITMPNYIDKQLIHSFAVYVYFNLYSVLFLCESGSNECHTLEKKQYNINYEFLMNSISKIYISLEKSSHVINK